MSIERHIAWKFMMKATERGTFSPMTLFAWLAIGVGIGAMSSLLSVMYGFEGALRERVLKAYPHVIVRPRQTGQVIPEDASWTKKFRAIPDVRRVLPYLEGEMILESEHRTLGGVMWGIDGEDLERLRPEIKEGRLPDPNAQVPELIIGSELADKLSVTIGSKIKIVSPLARSGAVGMVPRLEWFTVVGTYSSGHYEFDQQYLFVLMADAQDLLGRGENISGWHIWANDLEESQPVQKAVAAILPESWEAQDWSVFNAALFQSLKLEQYAMFSILCFAIVIAVLNIVITLTMHVTHKRRNIGVLRALGASTHQIRRIFVWQGSFLGLVGLVLGAVITILAFVYIRYVSTFQLPDIYYDRSIPIEVRPMSMVTIYAVATIMIFFATLYPAFRAAKLDPVEAIRE